MADIPPAVLRTQMARHLADHARITVHGLGGIFVSEWELEAVEQQAATPPASAKRDAVGEAWRESVEKLQPGQRLVMWRDWRGGEGTIPDLTWVQVLADAGDDAEDMQPIRTTFGKDPLDALRAAEARD